MEPEINIGDLIVVKEKENYEIGDIISYRHGETVITHRITDILETDGAITYKTKGDNNNAEDSGTVSSDLVEGKVVKILPTIRKNYYVFTK